jgi:peptidyl-prolyl cis-trans isomerase D
VLLRHNTSRPDQPQGNRAGAGDSQNGGRMIPIFSPLARTRPRIYSTAPAGIGIRRIPGGPLDLRLNDAPTATDRSELEGDFVLDTFRKSQRWLTGIIITLVGIAFVFFLGIGGSAPGPQGPDAGIVVSLDAIQIDTIEYARVRETQEGRMRETLGDRFDSKTAAAFVDSQTLRGIVTQAILSNSASELGYAVSTNEIKDILKKDGTWRDEQGRFDQDTFDADIKWRFGSQANFIEVMKRDLLQQKMVDLLTSQSGVSDAEAKAAALFETEEVRIAYIALDGNNLPESSEPSEDAIQAYFEANRDEIQTQFDSLGDRFGIPAQVRLRHILFEYETSTTEDAKKAAEDRAKAALVRLEAGEEFEKLAEELSDDAISKAKGGDLGLISKGDTNPNLESIAFEIEVGTVSELIEGPDGFHVIRVDEKIEASMQPFEEAGLTLAADGARAAAAKNLAGLLSAAIDAGETLEDAARAIDQTLERTGFFKRRRDGFIPQLGRGSPELMAAAFTLSLDEPTSTRVFEVENRQILIQLMGREEPDEVALETAQAAAAERLKFQRRNEVITAWVDAKRDELTASNRLRVNAEMVAGS